MGIGVIIGGILVFGISSIGDDKGKAEEIGRKIGMHYKDECKSFFD